MIPGLICGTCDFYYHLENQCRIEKATPLPMPQDDGRVRVIGFFPPTQRTAWCGEHSEYRRVKAALEAQLPPGVISLDPEQN